MQPAAAQSSSATSQQSSGTTARANETKQPNDTKSASSNAADKVATEPADKSATSSAPAKPGASASAAKPEGAAPAAKQEHGTQPEKPASASAEAGGNSGAGSKPAEKKDPDLVHVENGSQILINIDKSTQEMTVFVDGIEKYTWPVSTGKRGYSTPSGDYAPTSMNEMWYSKQWDNAPMPHAIFFMKDGHAIHGSYEVKQLGKPASHGCVRLSPQNATVLFDLVKKNGMNNTQVVLTGTTPGGEAKIADQDQGYDDYGAAPAYPGGRGYYYPPPRYYQQRPRRGLFGGFFQPYPPAAGYYGRGYYPRGY